MGFGPAPQSAAEGATLANSAPRRDRRLRAAAVAEVTLAWSGRRVDALEDAADTRLAAAPGAVPAGQRLAVTAAFAGRVNLGATHPGMMRIDVAAINAPNRVHPAITLATLPPLMRVAPGSLCGTAKIIFPVVPESERRADGTAGAAGAAAKVLILTGSVGPDLHDVARKALRRDGGQVLRFGMPVDPRNLPFPGRQTDRRPVIGRPGCASGPALTGAGRVPERLAWGLKGMSDDISATGMAGLLKKTAIRPQPRGPRP